MGTLKKVKLIFKKRVKSYFLPKNYYFFPKSRLCVVKFILQGGRRAAAPCLSTPLLVVFNSRHSSRLIGNEYSIKIMKHVNTRFFICEIFIITGNFNQVLLFLRKNLVSTIHNFFFTQFLVQILQEFNGKLDIDDLMYIFYSSMDLQCGYGFINSEEIE